MNRIEADGITYVGVPEAAEIARIATVSMYRRCRDGTVGAIRVHGKWMVPLPLRHAPRKSGPPFRDPETLAKLREDAGFGPDEIV